MSFEWSVQDKLRDEIESVFVDRLKERIREVSGKVHDLWDGFSRAYQEDVPYLELVEIFSTLPEVHPFLEEIELLHAKLKDCFTSVGETLNAPKIGYDPEATEWLEKKWLGIQEILGKEGNIALGYRAFWDRPFNDILLDETGKYVLELADSPGIGAIKSGSSSDACNFKGGVLPTHCRCIIGDELSKQAEIPHVAQDLKEYGYDLLDAAREYAEEHELEWVEHLRDESSDVLREKTKDEDVWRLLLCFDAGKWAIFWGENGHDMQITS